MRQFRRRLATCLLLAGVGTVAVPPAQAQMNGTLGIFFDDRGNECSQSFKPPQSRTLYVVLLPEGDTRGGISTAEFSIDTSGAPGYIFSGEQLMFGGSAFALGPFVGEGSIMATQTGCVSSVPIPLLRLQVTNVSGGNDAFVQIAAKSPPFNHNFPCPSVTLCNDPIFTQICVTPDRAVFNPSGALRCGTTSEKSEWGRVKELYR